MTYWQARAKAEIEYKKALNEWKRDGSQRNADRVIIKWALLVGLQRHYRGQG